MLTNILRGNQNFIPIIIFIMWLTGFFFLNVNTITSEVQLISFALITLSVGYLCFVVGNFPYFQNNFYFIFLFLAAFLFIGCCLENLNFFAGLFFLSLIITQILNKNQNEDYLFNAFDLGFYTGLAIIFYPPFWIFGIFLLLHFIILGKTQIVNLIFSLIGILALFILCIELIAIFDVWYYWDIFVQQIAFKPFTLTTSHYFLLPLMLIAAIGIIDYYSNLNRQSANKKAVFFDALLWFIISLIFILLYNGPNDNGLLLLLLPIVLFGSNFLTYTKIYWHKEVLIWVFIASLVLYRFNDYIKIPDLFDTITF